MVAKQIKVVSVVGIQVAFLIGRGLGSQLSSTVNESSVNCQAVGIVVLGQYAKWQLKSNQEVVSGYFSTWRAEWLFVCLLGREIAL